MTRHHHIPEMLASQPVFSCLDGDELASLAQGAYEHNFDRNCFLYQKGAVLQGMHLVINGQIKLMLSNPAGAEKIVLMAGPGDTFGEEALFTGRPSPVTAQANKESLVLVLQKAALRENMHRNQGFADALMARMGERMCLLIENLETCVQRSSAQRVAHFLSQRAPEEASCYDLELDMSKSTIASQLNLAPETFSRALSRLSREGLIDLRGRNITLRNLDSLRTYEG
ncbi:MAG: Crp/Fnr family transcriptional regulator [Betaproteobacteria bacterium]|nr:Crp/Fnr family transcriptional regulator [Betaproteobacteria bacterium]